MSGLIKGVLTVFVGAALAAATILLVNFLLGTPVPAHWAALGAALFGLVYGLQARIFGGFYLVLFALNYAGTFIIQVVWTFTLGGLLWLLKVRSKPYFRPSSHSAVQGFWGWIYYATFFELWAYASGNP